MHELVNVSPDTCFHDLGSDRMLPFLGYGQCGHDALRVSLIHVILENRM